MPSARQSALDVLREWSRGELYAVALIDDAARFANLSSRDTAMVQTLVYGVLRNLSLLDHWSGHLSGGRDLDPASRWLLRMGIAQLLLLDMPEHAVVNETVNLATRAKGFINAILRRTIRERAELLAAADALPARTRYSHPADLAERLIKNLGLADAEALMAWNQQPAETYVRLNRLHPEAERAVPQLPGLTNLTGDFFSCESPPRAALEAGLCYAQDPSTAVGPSLLNPVAGEDVLDACAAPGGKTALMAQMMGNAGTIMATDASAARLRRLASNLDRLKVTNVNAALQDWTETKPTTSSRQKFDAILLDVPCSNTGVMRRRVDVRWRLKESDFAVLASAQLHLAKAVLRVLKPGGRLVYSTCSLDPEENEGVVRRLIADHPDVKLIEERRVSPLRDKLDGAYAALLTRG